MRIKNPRNSEIAEGDLTPMIDMTFQLIAFFMVLVNFSAAEQDQRIKLPTSALAKPPEQPFEDPRTIQLTDDSIVYFGGEEVPLSGLTRLLQVDTNNQRSEAKSLSNVDVIIRADANAPAGEVQEIIQACQEVGFEKYHLRAREKQR